MSRVTPSTYVPFIHHITLHLMYTMQYRYIYHMHAALYFMCWILSVYNTVQSQYFTDREMSHQTRPQHKYISTLGMPPYS